MKTVLIIACLIIFGFYNSTEAQSSNLPLTKRPLKSTITLISPVDTIIGTLYELKDTSILVSSLLKKEDYYSGNYEVAELYIDNINLIKSNRQVGPLTGGILGAIVGAGVFALGTRIAIGPPPYPSGWFGFSADINYIVTVPAGAILGATTGAIIGSIRIKIPINGSMDNYNRQKKKLGRYTIQYPGAPTH